MQEAEPEYFLYENNYSMASAIRESISEAFGFEPVMINSALVSAQSRKRLYWIGRNNGDGTYSRCMIPQPEDRKIFLTELDLAIQYAIGMEMEAQGKTKGFTVTASEIAYLIKKHCGVETYHRVLG